MPQNRERIYIVGFDKSFYGDVDFDTLFEFPAPSGIETRVGQILQSDNEVDQKYTISQRLLDGHIRRKKEHKEKGNGFGFSIFDRNDRHTNTIQCALLQRWFKY